MEAEKLEGEELAEKEELASMKRISLARGVGCGGHWRQKVWPSSLPVMEEVVTIVVKEEE